MKIFNKIKKMLNDRDYRLYVYERLGILNFLPDNLYLKFLFKERLGYRLNLKNPKSFNEKLQWLKIHDRNPQYTQMVDKIQVKEYVANIIGSDHIIPTLGVWDDPADINYDELPNQFVLKCNHNSGTGMYICKDKSEIDIKSINKELIKGLKENYFYSGREWPYKNVKPRILAEKYMVDESQSELKDYKIFCFNGTPHYIQVDYGRFTNHERNIYSTDWTYMGFTSMYPTNPNHIIEKPKCLDEMLKIAQKLSRNIPHVRVDLYVIGEKIYFGELTFYHGSGFEKYSPEEWDKKLGELLQLSRF